MTDERYTAAEGLTREYDVTFKFDSDTNGPPTHLAEPYLLLYVAFHAMTGETRTSGTLRYALTRSLWRRETDVQEADRDLLRELGGKWLTVDLLAIDRGDAPEWLDLDKPLFLPRG